MTRDVPGSALSEGDTIVEHMPDGTSVPHIIDHFRPYPGCYLGDDHVRRAYDAEGRWCCTVPDHQAFHLLSPADCNGRDGTGEE